MPIIACPAGLVVDSSGKAFVKGVTLWGDNDVLTKRRAPIKVATKVHCSIGRCESDSSAHNDFLLFMQDIVDGDTLNINSQLSAFYTASQTKPYCIYIID